MKGQNQIFIPNQSLTLEGVQNFYVYVEKEDWKYETLIDILEIVTIDGFNERKKSLFLF